VLFLEPLMLFFLLGASIPLLIHFFNRMRFKTVYWAATIFLSKAFKKSTRIAKIKELLILLCRILAIFAIAIAFARPLSNGLTKISFLGNTDKIFIVLDRSASMSAKDLKGLNQIQGSLIKLSENFQKMKLKPPYLLIDSADKEIKELMSLDALLKSELSKETDTTSIIPEMISKILDYIHKNKIFSFQIWIISDGQRSDWNPNSDIWKELSAKIADKKIFTSIFLIKENNEISQNISIMEDYFRRDLVNSKKFELSLKIISENILHDSFPVVIESEYGKTPLSVNIKSKINFLKVPLELPEKQKTTRVKIEIPEDKIPFDNRLFFAFGELNPPLVGIYCTDNYLKNAIISAISTENQDNNFSSSIISISHSDLQSKNIKNFDLLIYEITKDENISDLEDLVKSSKITLLFPGEKNEQDIKLPAELILSSSDISNPNIPFISADFISNSSLLPKEISELLTFANFAKRFHVKGNYTEILKFTDNKPLLIFKQFENVKLYLFSAPLNRKYTNFIEHPVFPILIRNLYLEVSNSKSFFRNITAHLADKQEASGFQNINSPANSIPFTNAGFYHRGEEIVAVNPPEPEYERVFLSNDELKNLLPGKISIVNSDPKSFLFLKEIWRELLILALTLLILEQYLCLSFSSNKKL